MKDLAKQILDTQLEESVFSSNPARRRQAFSRLHRLMDKPLHAKDAVEKVRKHADHPKVMADFEHFAKHSPDLDVRPLLKKHMKHFSTQKDS